MELCARVTKDFKFAKNIEIHDVTLRDGEQQTGVILTKDDKIRIAEALAEAGVHRIEAGMPIVSPPTTTRSRRSSSAIWGRRFLFRALHEGRRQARHRHRR